MFFAGQCTYLRISVVYIARDDMVVFNDYVVQNDKFALFSVDRHCEIGITTCFIWPETKDDQAFSIIKLTFCIGESGVIVAPFLTFLIISLVW